MVSPQVQEMIGSLNTSNAVVAFDKMEEKVRGEGPAGCYEGVKLDLARAPVLRISLTLTPFVGQASWVVTALFGSHAACHRLHQWSHVSPL